jgi:PHD/YefM family antitoxin component YafN of YafNO toxin-antitoxin module
MALVPVSEARKELPAIIEAAESEAVVLQRRGRAVAVLLSPARYEALLEAEEEIEDVEAFDAAMAEGGDTVPWEQVKVDLGWT